MEEVQQRAPPLDELLQRRKVQLHAAHAVPGDVGDSNDDDGVAEDGREGEEEGGMDERKEPPRSTRSSGRKR